MIGSGFQENASQKRFHKCIRTEVSKRKRNVLEKFKTKTKLMEMGFEIRDRFLSREDLQDLRDTL